MIALLCIATSLFLSGCILVRELEVETTDAAVSTPPVIESAAFPFEFPGPIDIDRADVDSVISLTLLDNDLDDVLHVRMFLDYNIATGASQVSSCTASASGERSRVAGCPVDRICSPLDPADQSLHSLEAVVTDRDWLTADDPAAEGQPPLREVAPESTRVVRGWSVRCI